MFSSVLSLSLPLGLLSLGFFLFHSSTRSSESSMVSDEEIHSKASSAAPLVRSASMSSSGLQSSHHSSRHPSFFHREILKNSSVTCNDGTTAGYFIRSNPQSKRWLVFLEGGWHCYSQVSCHQRWIRARPLMTSAHWPQMRSSEYISPVFSFALFFFFLQDFLFAKTLRFSRHFLRYSFSCTFSSQQLFVRNRPQTIRRRENLTQSIDSHPR